MNISDRITKVAYIKKSDVILSADIKGRIHLFDRDLRLIKSSPSTHYNNMINAITFDERYVYTKDTRGVIGKWDLETLRPLDFHDDYSLRDERYLIFPDEEPSPSNSRGIAVFKDKLYVNNGYMQFVVIDVETFNVVNIYPPFTTHSAVDCVCAENSEYQVISETCGVVHIGKLDDMLFDKKISIDGASVHIVRYDKRHNRFIATQDVGLDEDKNIKNGIVTFNPDGTNKKEYPFTNDDVEFILFSEDYQTVFAGGFDGCLYVFDNTNIELKLKHVIGPYKHQLIGAVIAGEDVYLLMQSGEFIKTNFRGEIKAAAEFDYRCVWALEPHPNNDSILFCASGYDMTIFEYTSARYNSINIKKKVKNAHSFGIIFRVCPLPDSSYIALSRDNIVFRSEYNGEIMWCVRLEDLPKNVAVNSEFTHALVGLNNGSAYEIDITSGELINRINMNSPVYITGYTNEGKVIGTKQGDIYVYNHNFEELCCIKLDGYPKRFFKINEKYYLTGSFGFVELDLSEGKVSKTFIEGLWNTKENGIVLGDYVFVISYGRQIGAYSYNNNELVDLIESLYDYPKGLMGKTDNENDILIVGGNGGYVNFYRIVEGLLFKVREFYI